MEVKIEEAIEQPSQNEVEIRVEAIFELQKKQLQAIRNTSIKERKNKLKALKKQIFKYQKSLQDALYKDFKKPSLETDISEIHPVISDLKHNISHIENWAQKEYVDTPLTLMGSSSYIQYEPKGNVLIITPWNYPIYLSFSPIASAIAAGNTIILKPSEFTPNVNKVIKEILASLFPESEVAVIEGDYKVSTKLLSLKFDHIHFTGSPAVGKIVMQAAAKNLTSCTLELGGKSPTIVDETANLKDTASKLVWGKFINQGQTCIAPDYLLVHSSVKKALIDLMKKEIAKRYGNSAEAIKQSSSLCRIVNQKHFNRINNLINKAVENNASLETEFLVDAEQKFISPVLVSNVNPDEELMQEEIFGPVLPILSFEKLDEAIAIINNKEKPLSLYIFSKKSKNIDKILNETSSGGVCINETLLHITNPYLPFGGVNNSGIGKSHGKWGFVDFSNEKGVLKQHLSFGASKLMYPPYTKWTKRLIDLTMKWF